MSCPKKRDGGKESFRVPNHVAEFLRRVSKTQRVPLARLVAEALTTWCQVRGLKGITHERPPSENANDLRW